VRGIEDLDNITCNRILDLLEAGYLRLGETVIKKITVIKFVVDERNDYYERSGNVCVGAEVSVAKGSYDGGSSRTSKCFHVWNVDLASRRTDVEDFLYSVLAHGTLMAVSLMPAASI